MAYVIGYTFVGIQWINHHRLFDPLETVTPKIMWKNLNWLFWMTLLPFVIEWTGAQPFDPIPATVFCALLLTSTVSFNELQREIIRDLGTSSVDAREIQTRNTGALSVVITAAGTLVALFYPAVSFTIFLTYGVVRIVRDLLGQKKA